MTLSERLQRLLQARGVSINAAAERAGMERMQVYRIVQGKTTNPGVLTVQRIVEASGGTLGELFADGTDGR